LDLTKPQSSQIKSNAKKIDNKSMRASYQISLPTTILQ
jgi:hypothetical protein